MTEYARNRDQTWTKFKKFQGMFIKENRSWESSLCKLYRTFKDSIRTPFSFLSSGTLTNVPSIHEPFFCKICRNQHEILVGDVITASCSCGRGPVATCQVNWTTIPWQISQDKDRVLVYNDQTMSAPFISVQASRYSPARTFLSMKPCIHMNLCTHTKLFPKTRPHAKSVQALNATQF